MIESDLELKVRGHLGHLWPFSSLMGVYGSHRDGYLEKLNLIPFRSVIYGCLYGYSYFTERNGTRWKVQKLADLAWWGGWGGYYHRQRPYLTFRHVVWPWGIGQNDLELKVNDHVSPVLLGWMIFTDLVILIKWSNKRRTYQFWFSFIHWLVAKGQIRSN